MWVAWCWRWIAFAWFLVTFCWFVLMAYFLTQPLGLFHSVGLCQRFVAGPWFEVLHDVRIGSWNWENAETASPRFYGETRRSVDDGLLLLNLCEEERNTIAARLISTVFMLNSALGTLANGLLELQQLGWFGWEPTCEASRILVLGPLPCQCFLILKHIDLMDAMSSMTWLHR